MVSEAQSKPVGKEPVIPRVEVDVFGQEWTITATGGRLKRGGTIGPGAPKKEVREKWLAFANKPSLEWAQRVLSNPDIPDEAPVKLKAIELSLAYGLGKQDEQVQLNQDSAKVWIEATMQVLLNRGTSDPAGIVADIARSLGIKE